MKTGVIIQARTGSSRLPAKVTADVSGKSMLYRLIQRLQLGNVKEDIIVVTSTNPNDDIICKIASNANAKYFKGSEDDVLDRYIKAAQEYGLDYIVRIGGDDPLIDPECVNKLIEEIQNDPTFDFIYASHRKGWIYGTAAEIIKVAALVTISGKTTEKKYLEHIIPYFHEHPDEFKIKKLYSPPELNRTDILLSVDYQEDLDIIKSVYEHFINQNKLNFTQLDLIGFLDENPEIRDLNKHLQEGFAA